MPATEVYREEGTKPDGSRYEMVAWAVPETEAYPDGIKYSFQHTDADGNTLLRYDNARTIPTSAGTTATRLTANRRRSTTRGSPIWSRPSRTR